MNIVNQVQFDAFERHTLEEAYRPIERLRDYPDLWPVWATGKLGRFEAVGRVSNAMGHPDQRHSTESYPASYLTRARDVLSALGEALSRDMQAYDAQRSNWTEPEDRKPWSVLVGARLTQGQAIAAAYRLLTKAIDAAEGVEVLQ